MPAKRHRKRNRFFLILLVVGLTFFVWLFISIAKYIPTIYQLFFHKEIELKKTQEQRINMVLLGIGGGTHDGPLLTDTIIFASLDPQQKHVTLVSIPRDLWMSEIGDKINAAYSNAEIKQEGGGLLVAKAAISKIVGQPIDYGFRIDFGGFVKAVDMIGGLDVSVDRTFDDYAYPVSGKENDTCGMTEDNIASLSAQIATGSATESESFSCRYEHLHFDKGPAHMDGETALTFVRSRHALGPEGSDFSRSKRQEKIIRAFKDEVFSAGTLLNPVKIVSLTDTLKDSIDTDIKTEEYDDFIKLAEKMRAAKIVSVIINQDTGDNLKNELLLNPPLSEEYSYKWVLIPRAGAEDYSEIQSYVSCVIKTGTDCLATPTPSPMPTKKKLQK
jgi:LCP family protein required for cell wall assembly